MKIVADKNIPYLKNVFEPFCDIVYRKGNEIDRVDVLDADVLIVRTRTSCNKKLLEGTKIKFIASATIGFDHIDTEYCQKNNITWVNSPGCNSGAVLQWVMAATLMFSQQKSLDLRKSQLGVVGIGNVGRKIVKFSEAIGMPVMLNDPPRERREGMCMFRSIDSILKECNIISIHVPLNRGGIDNTFHLFNRELIAMMRPDTLLLNASRGEVIKTSDLEEALNTNKISAILDVWENEPDISQKLLDKVSIGTQHIAGYSLEGKANGTAMVVQEVAKFLNLPLDNWYPDELGLDLNSNLIEVDCKDKSVQDIFTEIVFQSYDIRQDDKELRTNAAVFEKLRSSYNFRTEPGSRKIRLKNEFPEIIDALRMLDMQVI